MNEPDVLASIRAALPPAEHLEPTARGLGALGDAKQVVCRPEDHEWVEQIDIARDIQQICAVCGETRSQIDVMRRFR